MKSTQTISMILLGVLMFSPLVSFAETGTSTQASGKRLNGLPPGTPVGSMRMMGTGTKPLPAGMEMRNKMASGTKPLPDGMEMRNKMTASGTRPLPPGMEKRMEDRDDMRTKMMGSSTERDCIGDSSGKTDCVGKKRGEEMRGKMMERRSEILKRMANQMLGRMNAAIERITKLADRIDSRILKLKGKSIDTSKAEASIVIARTKIGDAKAAVVLAQSAVAGALINADTSASSTTSVDAGKPVREALEKARVAVVAAHKALIDAIEALKANTKIDGEVHASTTSSVGN